MTTPWPAPQPLRNRETETHTDRQNAARHHQREVSRVQLVDSVANTLCEGSPHASRLLAIKALGQAMCAGSRSGGTTTREGSASGPTRTTRSPTGPSTGHRRDRALRLARGCVSVGTLWCGHEAGRSRQAQEPTRSLRGTYFDSISCQAPAPALAAALACPHTPAGRETVLTIGQGRRTEDVESVAARPRTRSRTSARARPDRARSPYGWRGPARPDARTAAAARLDDQRWEPGLRCFCGRFDRTRPARRTQRGSARLV